MFVTKETNIDFVSFAKHGLGLVFVIHDFNGSEGDIVNHDNKSTRNLQVSYSSKIRKVFIPNGCHCIKLFKNGSTYEHNSLISQNFFQEFCLQCNVYAYLISMTWTYLSN